MSAPTTRTLKDYRPQHDEDCARNFCPVCSSTYSACQVAGDAHGIRAECSCGLDAIISAASQEKEFMCIAEIKSIKPGDLSRHILGMENKTPLIGRDINGNLRDANGDVVGGDWNPMRRDKGIECDRTISPKKGGK